MTLNVERLAMPIDSAVPTFRGIADINAGEPTEVELAGRAATMFSARPSGLDPVGLLLLGTGADINEWSNQQFFVDLDHETLLIRTEVVDRSAKEELAEVVASMQIEQ